MNVLKPELTWIEGRCYRVNDASSDAGSYQEHDLYESDNFQTREESDDDGDEDFDVEQLDETRYRTNFHVSRHYLGSVIGKRGATRQRIEHDTKTEIKIPRHGLNGDIVIMGTNASNVKAARRRINMIVTSSRLKQRPTHFISIPMNSNNIIENFNKFKETILKEFPDKGIDESIFIPAMKLHITSGVTCLMDNEERLQMSKLLTEAKDKIIMPIIKDYLPLTIRLRGLSYMNDDPTNINVLYGNVHEENAPEGVLQRLADSIVQYFYKAGFINNKEFGSDQVKLHVTLINSKYRSQPSTANESSHQSRTPRVSFDGSRILKEFADYDFGTAQVTEIHLSIMHQEDSDGYYPSSCVLPLC